MSGYDKNTAMGVMGLSYETKFNSHLKNHLGDMYFNVNDKYKADHKDILTENVECLESIQTEIENSPELALRGIKELLAEQQTELVKGE